VRIVCAGLATVDLVYRVDRIPGPDEKAQATSVEIAAGGPAANAAITAAVLGAEVTLVTAVGAHPLGDLIRAELHAYGVTLLDAAPDSPAPPPVSAVTVVAATGQRSIVSRNAGDVAVDPPYELDRMVHEAGAVLVDGHHPALARAAAYGARQLIVDAGSWRPVFADILPGADVVACSAQFRPPGGLAAIGARHVAVTDGPHPVRWWSGDRSGEVAVPPVRAVDTAGAGDAFHGALTVAVARGRSFPDALRYAVTAAGIRVTHAGPRDWLRDPRLNELRG
jgi:sugar/nucleoside kinase (ribokinase family)